MPLSTTFEPFVSALIYDYVESGRWVARVAAGNPSHPLACPIHAEDRDQAPNNSQQISIQHMLWPLMVFWACCAVGLLQLGMAIAAKPARGIDASVGLDAPKELGTASTTWMDVDGADLTAKLKSDQVMQQAMAEAIAQVLSAQSAHPVPSYHV